MAITYTISRKDRLITSFATGIVRGLGRLAVVAESQTTYRVAKTFLVIARAIGIDVDVFKELAPAEAWLDE